MFLVLNSSVLHSNFSFVVLTTRTGCQQRPPRPQALGTPLPRRKHDQRRVVRQVHLTPNSSAVSMRSLSSPCHMSKHVHPWTTSANFFPATFGICHNSFVIYARPYLRPSTHVPNELQRRPLPASWSRAASLFCFLLLLIVLLAHFPDPSCL